MTGRSLYNYCINNNNNDNNNSDDNAGNNGTPRMVIWEYYHLFIGIESDHRSNTYLQSYKAIDIST